jgi:hypothetical protein
LEKTISKAVIKALQSGQPDAILNAIKTIRSHGLPEHLKPLLEVLKSSDHPEIFEAIVQLFDDLNDQGAVHHLVIMIEAEDSQRMRRILVSSCWKSGLDYSAHLMPFFKIFVQDDFETAFEAYTLIDSNIHNAKPEEFPVLAEYLKESWARIPEDRRMLASDLVDVMNSYTGT